MNPHGFVDSKQRSLYLYSHSLNYMVINARTSVHTLTGHVALYYTVSFMYNSTQTPFRSQSFILAISSEAIQSNLLLKFHFSARSTQLVPYANHFKISKNYFPLKSLVGIKKVSSFYLISYDVKCDKTKMIP